MKQVNKSQVRLHQEEPSADFRNEPAPSQGRDKQIRNRATGLLILLVLAGAYWVYGWAGKITLIDVSTQPVNWTSQVIYAKLLVLSAVFTIIGYGLLLSYYKNMSASAFLISLFVVSFTLIISPFISKFWFNVFLSDFKGNTFSAVTTPDRFLKYSFGGMDVFLDFYNLKVGMVNSISQLVMLLGVFGRLNAIQIVLNTIFYNITWNLCHFLCANLQLQGPDSRIFDDYQISNVYLFASCYSLILLLILKSPRISMKADIQSSVLALLGTFFVFLSFCATSTLFPLKFTPGQAEYARSYIWQEGFLNIFFALVGSVIFSCVGSIVLGGFTEGSKALEGKIGLRECVFGTITGGIIYGPVAGTAVNIGAAIASGLFSGLLSSIIYRFVVNKINSSELRDSYGVTNTLSVSFMATFCISPSILIAYFNRDWILPTLEVSNFDKVGLPLINASIAGWVIAYVGISMGIGLVSGAAAGGILFFFKSVSRGHDQDFFNMQYGLTSSNVQALQEDYLQSTNFQRVMRLLKSKNLVSSSAVSMVETTEIKKEGQQFKSTYISNLDVQIHDKIDDVVLEQYRKQLRAIVPNANVVRAEGGLLTSGQPQEASQRNRVRKFRAIYGQIKSRQLEDSLSSSSLVNLKAETTQRSVAGNEERRVAIRSTFERLDDGVALLNAYDKSCEDMSLQVDIQA